MDCWFQKLAESVVISNVYADSLKKLQDKADWTELMVRFEELKVYPFGDVWEEYCAQCGTSERGWFDEIKEYEKEVLSKR